MKDKSDEKFGPTKINMSDYYMSGILIILPISYISTLLEIKNNSGNIARGFVWCVTDLSLYIITISDKTISDKSDKILSVEKCISRLLLRDKRDEIC